MEREMKKYNFYGWEQADVSAVTDVYAGIRNLVC